MAQEIRIGADQNNIAGLTLGTTDIQFVRLGETLVWQNNQIPAIRLPDQDFDEGANVDITVVANQDNVFEFDVKDPDPDGHITEVKVTDPEGVETQITLNPPMQNEYSDLEYTIPAAQFPNVGPIVNDNVWNIHVEDDQGGVGNSTFTVTYASFEGPVLSLSGTGSGNSGTRQVTVSVAAAGAGAPANVRHFVAIRSSSLQDAINAVEAWDGATGKTSDAVNVNVACDGSTTVYAAGISYDPTNSVFSGVKTATGTASHTLGEKQLTRVSGTLSGMPAEVVSAEASQLCNGNIFGNGYVVLRIDGNERGPGKVLEVNAGTVISASVRMTTNGGYDHTATQTITWPGSSFSNNNTETIVYNSVTWTGLNSSNGGTAGTATFISGSVSNPSANLAIIPTISGFPADNSSIEYASGTVFLPSVSGAQNVTMTVASTSPGQLTPYNGLTASFNSSTGALTLTNNTTEKISTNLRWHYSFIANFGVQFPNQYTNISQSTFGGPNTSRVTILPA